MKVITCAIRGRNVLVQNCKIKIVQKLEMGGEIANSITTVQKDSLVVEIYENKDRQEWGMGKPSD